MKALLVLAFVAGVSFYASAQTNYVYVVNDDSAEVVQYWDSGLRIGGWVAAGVFGLFMIRKMVSGGSDKHEEN